MTITRPHLLPDFATVVAQDTLPWQRKAHPNFQGYFGVTVV